MSDKSADKNRRFVKIPQTRATVIRNIVFATGLIFLAAGLGFLLLVTFSGWEKFPYASTVVFALGVLAIFLVFGVTKSGILLSIGLSAAFSGILGLLCSTKFIPFTLKQLWPGIVIICGVSVFISGLYSKKKIKSWFLFPACSLVFLGIVFLLFSFHVIKISFATFIYQWWPVLFIVVGVLLIGIFVVQQRHNKVFPYMEDDSAEENFSEE